MPMDNPMSTLKYGKRIAISAVGAAMLLTGVLPALAERPTTRSATSTRPDGGAACAHIGELAAKLEDRLDAGRQKLLDRRDDRAAKLAERRADELAKLADRRQEWENHWNDLISRLEANGATNTAAIAAFKTSMEAAWKARNAAID